MGNIGVCEFNDGSGVDCMDKPDAYCNPPVQCEDAKNQLIPNDLSSMRTVDPEPSLVWFIDTGVYTIFPDRVAGSTDDFLWHYGASAEADVIKACPPKNC